MAMSASRLLLWRPVQPETEPQPGDLLLRAARQRAGARSRWAGLGVSHRPGAYRDTMISVLPRRLRTADPREGHRPGGGAGGLGPPGRYCPDAVLAVSFFPLAPCRFIPSPVPQPEGTLGRPACLGLGGWGGRP